MDTLIVYTKNKEQLIALKVAMKTMKISFEQKSQIYPQHVIYGVNESIKQADEGLLMPYTGIKDWLHNINVSMICNTNLFISASF